MLSFLILSLEPGAVGARLRNSTATAGLALGADAYVDMPVFDPHKLVALINKLQPPVPVRQKSVTEEEKRRAE